MVLTGIIKRGRGEGPGWVASCDVIGVYAQGKNRKDAAESLADSIQVQIGRDGFKARVTESTAIGTDEYQVIVDSDQPEVLAAEVLKYQRWAHKLTLLDVQKKLGAGSLNAYAAYEQGKRAPSLAKFRELLAAVAPELVLSVGPREIGGAKRKATKAAR